MKGVHVMAKAGRPRKYADPQEGQRIANAKYREKNKDRISYLSKRSTCRSFIRSLATPEDIAEIKALIAMVELKNLSEEDNL